MFRSHLSTFGWAAALLLGAVAPAAAQVPSVSFVYPAGAQSGTKAAATLSGGNLKDATAVLIGGEGVEAKITKNTDAASLPVELTVAANAVPGPREVRVVTAHGTSNAGRIWIGNYPEVNEVEPNNTLAQPQKLEKLPVTVNGQINGGEDVDTFTFQAGAGDTFVFDLVAARMVSGLDGYLSLFDSRGKILQTAMEGYDRDPRLIHEFKTAGTYTIQVRDTTYRGGGNFTYKLTVGKVPAITGYLPMGGKHGQTVQVALEGVNLGNMKTMSVPIPMDEEQVTIVPNTPMGPAVTPISFAAGDAPELTEIEPNDTAAQAMPIGSVPVVINGRIDKPGDIDLYKIKPAAAGNLNFEIIGRRMGSRIDSFLRILDASGKVLSTNDDAEGKDSRLSMGVQANTEYLVEVTSLDQRHGSEAFYRLEIESAPGPDFELSVTPDAVNIGQGSSTVVGMHINRSNGFTGAVDLHIENLPAGVTASPAAILAGQGAAVARKQGKGAGKAAVPAAAAAFTLTAAPDAKPASVGVIRIVGKATINGKEVTRIAEPMEVYQPIGAAADARALRSVILNTATVIDKPPYTLEFDQKALTAKRGATVELKIKTVRGMNQNAAIPIALGNTPAGITATLVPIPEKQNEAVVKLAVAASAPLGPQNVIVTGNLANNIQAAPALVVTVAEK